MFANFINNPGLMAKLEDAAQQCINHISTIRQANVPIEGVYPPHVREAINMLENRIGEIVAWSQGTTLTFETNVTYLHNPALFDKMDALLSVIKNNAAYLKNAVVDIPDIPQAGVQEKVNKLQADILALQGMSQGYTQ